MIEQRQLVCRQEGGRRLDESSQIALGLSFKPHAFYTSHTPSTNMEPDWVSWLALFSWDPNRWVPTGEHMQAAAASGACGVLGPRAWEASMLFGSQKGVRGVHMTGFLDGKHEVRRRSFTVPNEGRGAKAGCHRYPAAPFPGGKNTIWGHLLLSQHV